MKGREKIALNILAAVFAALISLGSYIAIPVPGSPVPIVLQNFFIILAALLLGPLRGTLAVLIFLVMGAAGLPVFSMGNGGLMHFFGTTGGYLISYPIAAFVIGIITRNRSSLVLNIIAGTAGMIVIFMIGVPFLMAVLKCGIEKGLIYGCYPFIIGDIIKIAAAALIAWQIKPFLYNRLGLSIKKSI